ncbi:MAG: thiolase family protein [Firmicutes bacterium]|nr:thiolase family protein [Bacillota bacterium]
MREVFLVGGARTPFGSFGGVFKDVPAHDLAVAAVRASLVHSGAGVDASAIDQVVLGQVVQSAPDAAYFARHVALAAGVPVTAPALTVNRLCGSGLQAVVSAAEGIMLGYSDLAIAGGAENMSRIPYAMHGARFGAGLGKPELTDMLTATLYDDYAGCQMGETAEILADEYGISRARQDEFALRSQQLAVANNEARAEEITPVTVSTRRGSVVVSNDEHIRQDTTLERLGALRPVFRDQGTVTAGNASGINDGAAAVVLASAEAVAKYDLKPLARLVGYGFAGVDPRRMGIGPVQAMQTAVARAGWTLDEVDLFEVNEAFAAQTLAVMQALSLPLDRVNPQGGAIALGHPVGASGARLLLTAALQLRRAGRRKALVSLCIGGGQGIAAAIENLATF